MKTVVFFLLLLPIETFASRAYPRNPDPRLTPGSLCTEPISLRYPEKIPYCDRQALNSYYKEAVFMNYRKDAGYSLSGERSQYKVDHFIPLCAGGSNNLDNLWPQYYTISLITDPLEPLGCEKLAKGHITQRELVDLIMKAKMNHDEVPGVMKYLKSLR